MCYNCFELLKKREFCFTEQIINIDRMENAVALFGSFDGNIKLIEKEFNVRVTCRDSELKVEGDAENTSKACKVIESLLQFINRGEALSEQNIRYCISLVNEGSEDKIEQLAGDCICITSKGKPIKPKTIGQALLLADCEKYRHNRRRPCRYGQDLPCRCNGGHGFQKQAD